MRRTGFALIVAMMMAGQGMAQSAEDGCLAIQGVIGDQIEAFKADDLGAGLRLCRAGYSGDVPLAPRISVPWCRAAIRWSGGRKSLRFGRPARRGRCLDAADHRAGCAGHDPCAGLSHGSL